MKPGEKTGLGMVALMGLCCGGMLLALVAGPSIVAALSAGAWKLALFIALLALGAAVLLVAHRKRRTACGAEPGVRT